MKLGAILKLNQARGFVDEECNNFFQILSALRMHSERIDLRVVPTAFAGTIPFLVMFLLPILVHLLNVKKSNASLFSIAPGNRFRHKLSLLEMSGFLCIS